MPTRRNAYIAIFSRDIPPIGRRNDIAEEDVRTSAGPRSASELETIRYTAVVRHVYF